MIDKLYKFGPLFEKNMFTEEELKEKGAKRAVLEYIVSEDPSISIPETVAEEDIGDGVIVRSDHWREFDAFEGIFESIEVGKRVYNTRRDVVAEIIDTKYILDWMYFREIGIPEADREIRYQRGSFERYCKGKNLDPNTVMSEFRIFPQKKVNARVAGTIFSHPNVPDRYILHASGKGPQGGYNAAFMIDKKDEELSNIVGENNGGRVPLEMLLTVSPVDVDDMKKIIQFYNKVHSLPKFQDGFVYMMEFTYDPTYVLQMRRFRVIEDGSTLECSWKDEENVMKTDLTFGLTNSSEGIVLPYSRAEMLIGVPLRDELFTAKFFDFAEEHPEGFAYCSSDDSHTNTIFPNAKAALGNHLCQSFFHGTLANMAHMPFYFCGLKHQLSRKKLPNCDLRLFSKGSEGYVKVEPN